MPDAPVTPPAAPVKPPSKLPTFLTDLIRHYVTDAAPHIGAMAAKGLNDVLVKSNQQPLSAVEAAHVSGLTSSVVLRLASLLG